MKYDPKNTWIVVSCLVSFFALMFMLLYVLCSCTLSFQNISTHGNAEHVVDEDLTTDPTVSPDISIPVSAT